MAWRSLGPETLQQPPFPARAQPGQGRGLPGRLGGHTTPLSQLQGRGLAWGRLEGQTSSSRVSQCGARGAGETGCLVATPRHSPAGPLGRNCAATQGQVFCLGMGPGAPAHPTHPGTCPVPVTPASAFASHQLEAAGGCEERSPRGGMPQHSHRDTHDSLGGEDTEGGRTPSLPRKQAARGKGTGHFPGEGAAPP